MAKQPDNLVVAPVEKGLLELTPDRLRRLVISLEQQIISLEWQLEKIAAELEKSRERETRLRLDFRQMNRRRRNRQQK